MSVSSKDVSQGLSGKTAAGLLPTATENDAAAAQTPAVQKPPSFMPKRGVPARILKGRNERPGPADSPRRRQPVNIIVGKKTKPAAPVTKTSVTKTPSSTSSAKKIPARKAPVTKTSADKAPATKAPATKAPATKTPVDKAQAQDAASTGKQAEPGKRPTSDPTLARTGPKNSLLLGSRYAINVYLWKVPDGTKEAVGSILSQSLQKVLLNQGPNAYAGDVSLAQMRKLTPSEWIPKT